MERVKAVIFDWAGTVIDYGSLAPMGAFVETFGEFGVLNLHRRSARPDGHGQASAYRSHYGAAASRGSLDEASRACADRGGHRRRLRRVRAEEHRGGGALRESHSRRRGGRR